MVRSRPIKRYKTGCMDYVMPSPPTVAYKALSAALVLSVPSFYLSTSSLLFCHSSRSTPSARLLGFLQDIPLRYLGISPYLSLLSPLSSLCSRSSLCSYCFGCCRQCRRRSLRRISSSELARTVDTNNAIVNGTAVKKHLKSKTERNYARALGLWNGQVYSLGPLSFP